MVMKTAYESVLFAIQIPNTHENARPTHQPLLKREDDTEIPCLSLDSITHVAHSETELEAA
jgi:hypothetical protein